MVFQNFISELIRYLYAWDQWWLANINLVWTSPAANNFMPILADLPKSIFALILFGALAIYWILDEPQNGWKVTCLALASVVVTHLASEALVKSVVKRTPPVPTAEIPLQFRSAVHPTYSFPSTTAADAMALGVIVFATTGGLVAFLALILPWVAAYSTVYVGTHFPSDALAGLLLGFVIARIVWNQGGYWAKEVEYEDASKSRLKRHERTSRNPTGGSS